MSMKRSRAKTYGSSRRYDDAQVSFNKQGGQQPEKPWEEYVADQSDDAFAPYSMKTRFEGGALLSHPKFGKGVVLHVEEQRMDVLFADGKRKLGHGLA